MVISCCLPFLYTKIGMGLEKPNRNMPSVKKLVATVISAQGQKCKRDPLTVPLNRIPH